MNTTMQYAIADVSLGHVLIAATEQGTSAILLGDDAAALVRDVQARFPNMTLVQATTGFRRYTTAVKRLIERPTLRYDLPLDVQGTAFQQRVWSALRDIPAGTTASYATIAARIGMPNAVRAVAGACAANSLGVVIPCHRVVRADGSLSGYRWGVERKAELLRREGVIVTA